MIADLKKSSNEELEGNYPIRSTMYPNLENNAHHFSNMHSLSLKDAFNNLTETSNDKENSERHFNVKNNQISFTNKHALQPEVHLVEMENENENLMNLVDFSMYDGMGNPQIHLKAYLDWLMGMEKGNKLKMRFFVRILTGPALMWYAKQDMAYQPTGIMPMSSHNLVVYPQFPNQIPPHGQAIAGPRFVAPNLSFSISISGTCDIDGQTTKNDFVKKSH
ncbi:hypothetical protein HAX54_050295 [Datura stramonium]|uniref:Uncharacterized protein n=1 Tax=Datura stramonium TaxID=4076 RepID=A0ABS8WNE4_DATST|nr:hypothetical protein [Datura stramonium]